MLEFSEYSLVASMVVTGLALLTYIVALTAGQARRPVAVPVRSGVGGSGSDADADEPATPAARRSGGVSRNSLIRFGTYFTWLSLLFITASLATRTIAVGHGPFSNQYEFAVSFAWGVLAAYVYFEWKYQLRILAIVVLPIAAILEIYATSIPGTTTADLVPALQNNFLLSVHVGAATLAYGAFAVACAAGALYLVQSYYPPATAWRGMPKAAVLDEISYRSVVVAFPLHTIMLILGAVWADVAWGSYWSWDPKETASLVTWLIYGGFLHARVVRGWRGRKAAWLLMLGFAAVVFTFMGNLFFDGLHAYGKSE